jgi:hypothetical protein
MLAALADRIDPDDPLARLARLASGERSGKVVLTP